MSMEFEIPLWAITIGTNLLQIYLIWLVIYKSSANMLAFRFALCSLLGNELIFSVVIGYIMDPELLFPYERGAAVKGLAQFLGKNGGRFAFSVALFFGAGVLWNQVYCLIFRYTAIQQHFDGLNAKFNRTKIRCLFMVIGYSISTACGFIAYHSMVAPENVYSRFLLNPPLLTWTNNNTVVMLLGSSDEFAMLLFGIFVLGGFVFATTVSIAFSVIIFHTINKNVNCFTARTYKLHRQLTLLLIVQFCLPIFFLIIPVCYAAASCIFGFNIGKLIGDLSMLLLSLYTMANALSTLIFITPYRDYTLKLFGIGKKMEQRRNQQIQSLRTTRIEIMPRSVE